MTALDVDGSFQGTDTMTALHVDGSFEGSDITTALQIDGSFQGNDTTTASEVDNSIQARLNDYVTMQVDDSVQVDVRGISSMDFDNSTQVEKDHQEQQPLKGLNPGSSINLIYCTIIKIKFLIVLMFRLPIRQALSKTYYSYKKFTVILILSCVKMMCACS